MERREKGVLREHQAAFAKMQTMKKHQGRMTTQKVRTIIRPFFFFFF